MGDRQEKKRKISEEKEEERESDHDQKSKDSERDKDTCTENKNYDWQGRELIEFFSVTVATKGPSHPYGTIAVDDGVSKFIYNTSLLLGDVFPYMYQAQYRRSNGKKYFFPFFHEIANLTGPERALEAYDPFSVELNLMSDDSPLDDNEVIIGGMDWDPYFHRIKYDKVIPGVVEGKYGTAYVYYAVFKEAVEARVEVTLIHPDRPKSVMISAINAFNSCIQNKKILLYREEEGQPIISRKRNPISLLRSIVVAPSDGTLTIEFQLVMSDGSGIKSVTELVVFETKSLGETKKTIEKDYGQIEVSVTWLSF